MPSAEIEARGDRNINKRVRKMEKK